MSYFVVTNTYVDAPELPTVRIAHREYLQTLIGKSGLKAAGPLPEATPPSGMLIFEGSSADEIIELLALDPLNQAGLISSQNIELWLPKLGDTF